MISNCHCTEQQKQLRRKFDSEWHSQPELMFERINSRIQDILTNAHRLFQQEDCHDSATNQNAKSKILASQYDAFKQLIPALKHFNQPALSNANDCGMVTPDKKKLSSPLMRSTSTRKRFSESLRRSCSLLKRNSTRNSIPVNPHKDEQQIASGNNFAYVPVQNLFNIIKYLKRMVVKNTPRPVVDDKSPVPEEEDDNAECLNLLFRKGNNINDELMNRLISQSDMEAKSPHYLCLLMKKVVHTFFRPLFYEKLAEQLELLHVTSPSEERPTVFSGTEQAEIARCLMWKLCGARRQIVKKVFELCQRIAQNPRVCMNHFSMATVLTPNFFHTDQYNENATKCATKKSGCVGSLNGSAGEDLTHTYRMRTRHQTKILEALLNLDAHWLFDIDPVLLGEQEALATASASTSTSKSPLAQPSNIPNENDNRHTHYLVEKENESPRIAAASPLPAALEDCLKGVQLPKIGTPLKRCRDSFHISKLSSSPSAATTAPGNSSPLILPNQMKIAKRKSMNTPGSPKLTAVSPRLHNLELFPGAAVISPAKPHTPSRLHPLLQQTNAQGCELENTSSTCFTSPRSGRIAENNN